MRLTTRELRLIATRELGEGRATLALAAKHEADECQKASEELDAEVTILREQLAQREQDAQIAHRAYLEARKTYTERCVQVRR
jgi:hypothetical protein